MDVISENKMDVDENGEIDASDEDTVIVLD